MNSYYRLYSLRYDDPNNDGLHVEEVTYTATYMVEVKPSHVSLIKYEAKSSFSSLRYTVPLRHGARLYRERHVTFENCIIVVDRRVLYFA